MHKSNFLSRRHFIRDAAAGVATCIGFTQTIRAAARMPAVDRIGLGFIGVGTMGGGHISGFLNSPEVQVVAVCDVVDERRDHHQKRVDDHYAKQKKGDFKACRAYRDFRDLLMQKDVDAVVISKPDHWHAIQCVLAARAGKVIYCEKPLTLTIAEGRTIADAVHKHKVVFQTGSQQRSEFGGRFCRAVELVRNGRIGKVHTVRIGVGNPARLCDLPEQPIPDGTDWDLWLGPAPKRGYNEVLCPKGVHRHFPAWREYREYAGGGLADMGAHHFDIAQLALDMDASGPVKVEPPADSKATSGLRFHYANGVVMHHNIFDGPRADCIFEGADGTIIVGRDELRTIPDRILKEPLEPKGFRADSATNHHQNWLDSIRTRRECICPAEVGHRSATICHLANIGYQLRRALHWDPKVERFVDDDEANQYVSRTMRTPWTL